MKYTRLSLINLLTLTLLVSALVGVGCTPAVPTAPAAAAPVKVAQAATATAPAPAPTLVVTTPPPSPTAPPAVPATAAPAAAVETATVVPVTPTGETTPEEVQKGLSAWCLPVDAAVSNAKDPLNPPKNAKKAKVTTNSLEVSGLPSNGCMFLYTFGQGAVTGLKLELYELKQLKPFLTADLTPAEGNPEVAWAFLRHVVFTAPPSENLSLTFVVRDPLGQVLQRDQVNLHSWIPGTPAPKQGGDCGCSADIP